MKVKEIRLKQFRRFTDTLISGIPAEARLVLLVGPNGCGKSAVIDAAYFWSKIGTGRAGLWDEQYHRKQEPMAARISTESAVSLTFQDGQQKWGEERSKSVYVRSAYRNDPAFQLEELKKCGPMTLETRINRIVDNDQAVSLNYARMASEALREVLGSAAGGETVAEFRERWIGEIREKMQRLFPGLALQSLGDPLSNGTFHFDKGEARGFAYVNLSGGEKAAFDLLLDVLIKKREFSDTVFFIDEPEAHLAPGLQGALLDELFDAIPASCQLWLATHSIGMMRRARDLGRENAGAVVFLDFDGVNFDLPVTLRPIEPSRPFWKRAMQIALDDLAGYVAPEHVVLCEGGRLSDGRDFDAECYNKIFAVEYPHVLFLGAGNVNDIKSDPRGVVRLVSALAPSARVTRLIDRDEQTETEVRDAQGRGVRVLSRRTIESYLLDDFVLQSICVKCGQPESAPKFLEQKDEALRASVAAGGRPDDYSRIAGGVYVAARKLFQNHKLGSDNRAFMKEICAEQVRPGTEVYGELKRDIFGA